MTARICLFCGSRTGNAPVFAETALNFGRELARRGHSLVYGAGDRGLMGIAATAAQEAGGHITGVIPQHLVDIEVGRSTLDRYVVTGTMHERKKLMFDNADAIVALPGGAGTLDELIEVLTWRQLGLHEKPIVLLNADGFWTPLMALIDHVIDMGFADAGLRELLAQAPDAETALDIIERRLDQRS